MRFRNFAAAMSGMALLALVSFAQTAKIEGDVIGFDGKPLPGAVVRLHRTDIIQDPPLAKTDKKGHFIYMGLAPGGQFNVSIEVDGKVVDTQRARASLNDQDPLKFDLAKSKAAKDQQAKAIAEAVQNGGQLTPEMERGMSSEEKDRLEANMKAQKDEIKKHADLNAAYSAGMTAIDQKQWPQAIENLEKASTIDPKQTAIWANLADSYLADATAKSGADKDAEVQKGMDSYGKAIELKPDDAAIHNNYGNALAKAGKSKEAMAEMEKAAQLDPPGAGKYYYNLGAILLNTNQADAALAAFQKSVAADPNYADSYYFLGSSMLSTAKTGPDGNPILVPGTIEAFQKCLSFGDKCSHAQECKDTVAALQASIQTNYSDPNAKQAPATTKKKK